MPDLRIGSTPPGPSGDAMLKASFEDLKRRGGPYRPELGIPSLREEIKDVDEERKKLALQRLKHANRELNQLTLEKSAALRKQAEVTRLQSKSSYRHLITTSLSACASIFIGAHLQNTHKPKGSSILALGVIELAKCVLIYSGATDNKKPESEGFHRYLPYVTTALTVAGLGLNIFIYMTTRKAQREMFLKAVSQVISFINTVAAASAIRDTWQKQNADRELLDVQAKVSTKNKQVEFMSRNLKTGMDDTMKVLKEMFTTSLDITSRVAAREL